MNQSAVDGDIDIAYPASSFGVWTRPHGMALISLEVGDGITTGVRDLADILYEEKVERGRLAVAGRLGEDVGVEGHEACALL